MPPDDGQIDPYTERAAEHLEDGFQQAIGEFTIDIAEIRESINDPEIKEALEQAEYCLNSAKRLWAERYVDSSTGDTDG